MVRHVFTEEGLNPRTGTTTVSAQNCVHMLSSVVTSGGHDQLIAAHALTEGQQEEEQ
jgi:hypothetical protein